MFVAAAAASADRCFLLPAAACHRLPDRQFGAGLLNVIPLFSFSSFKRDIFISHPVAVLQQLQLCRIHGLHLPTTS